jgi:phosphatidylserine/phosphatidylglycerophosphate/cardiolipin synthase-like enzyme
MDGERIRRALADTLEDHRLSRAERKALGEVLAEAGADSGSEPGRAALRRLAFEAARESLVDPEGLAALGWLEELMKLLHPEGRREDVQAAEAYFSPGDECPRRIIGLLAGARRSVEVCVFTITDDRISDAILQAHGRGVAVRVVTDNDKVDDEGSDARRIQAAGVPVRMDRTEYHMHHKFALFDGSAVLTGSYNWTRGASLYNDENFIVTGDPRLVSAFADRFERLWARLGD